MKIVLLLHLLLMLVGCNSEYADLSPLRKTRIHVKAVLPPAITADKIMLWAVNSNGNSFSRIIEADDSLPIIVNSGNYTFYAIAWTAANLSGDVYCGTTTSTLSGPDYPLDFNLTNNDCGESYFSGTGFAPTIPKTLNNVNVEWCDTLTNITGASDKCTDDLEDASRKEARGHSMSYRFVIHTYEKTGNRYSLSSDSITTSCISGLPNGATPLEGLTQGMVGQLPVGNGSNSPFYITLETFPGSLGCNENSHGKKTVTFKNGLLTDQATAKYETDGVTHKIYARMSSSEVCSGLGPQKIFSGGDGSRQAPYLICNEAQFYNTHLNPTSSFKLLKDIDLSRYYYGQNTLPNIPDGLTCLEKGSNFYPLGYDGTCTATAETFATSDFDGGGKTIKGLRIKMAGKDFVALYTKKLGGEIRRVNFTDVLIKGQNNVATLAGVTETSIRDISGTSINITGTGAYIGGIAGFNLVHPSPCEFRNINLNKLTVSTSNSYAGGIIGQSSSCDIRRSSVSGFIYSTLNYVGGISGNIVNGSIVNVGFEGYVKGNAYVGGLTGDLFGSIVTNSHVVADVLGTHTGSGIYLGGLIGYTNGNPNATTYVTNNYFFGQLNYYCTAVPISNCSISNIVGDPGSWGIADLNTNSYVSTNATIGYTALDVGTPRPLSDFFSTVAAWPAAFTKSTTDLPRLSHETNATASTMDLRHPCQSVPFASESVSYQIGAGLGNSENNPISICHFSQLKDMQLNATHASKFYKLRTFILGTEQLNPSTQTLSGQLDGDQKGLLRLTVKGGIGTQVGWWSAIATSGVIKNLFFIDSVVIDTSNNAATTSLIATFNRGLINGVYTLATKSTLGTLGEHSMFVHTNLGTIKNSFINGLGTVRNGVASVMFLNQGTFEDSGVSTYLGCHPGFSCNNIAGVAIENEGIIRRLEVTNSIIEQTAFAGNSEFAFISQKNNGLIEDVHISSTSQIQSKAQHVHGIVASNRPSGIVRRIYNEGRVLVYNGGLPSLTPATSTEYLEGATNTVGFNDGGVVSHIAYKKIPRWSFPSQYGYGSRSVSGVNECEYVLNGGLPIAWESALGTGLFTRFGLMVSDLEAPYLFTRNPLFTAADDNIYTFDTAACSMTVGNPVVYFVPFDQYNGNQLINQAESLMYTTFSTWSGVNDITADDSVVHEYESDKLNGVNSTKPVWIFDTTNSLRLYR